VAEKQRILIICNHYLPSTKGGGGAWTVANLVERFADRYEFTIITRNHPSPNDLVPFGGVTTNEWNTIGSAQVFYIRPSDLTARKIAELVRSVEPHGVFLNSVFSKPSVKFLVARRMKMFGSIPVLLAPCGELSNGALGLKRGKKRAFLLLSKLVKFHRNIVWKATSTSEISQITNALGPDCNVVVAPDLPPTKVLPEFAIKDKPSKRSGSVKVVYYSRIDRMKNLKYLLQLLSAITVGDISLTIAGPVDDDEYWRNCEAIMRTLPPNIKTEVWDALPYNRGLELLKASHFFILPTLGENLGYAILEAMAAGCPVIISDRTIWDAVNEKRAGWTIDLSDVQKWESVIEYCVQMDENGYRQMSSAARRFAVDWINDPQIEEANARALETAFGKCPSAHPV
jgi:glycosyltransferase involved in cell wall biosynthesis